jgi:hypothetical protein
MKTKLLLLLLSTGFYSFCTAQTIGPGTEWHYGAIDWMHPGPENHYSYKVIGTTEVEGDTGYRITGRNMQYIFMQDSTAIYYKSDSSKYLYFDTGHEVGDTLMIDAHFGSGFSSLDTIINMRIRISGIYFIKDNALDPNDSLKVFVVKDIDKVGNTFGHDSTGYFTEKVIHHEGPMPWNFYDLFMDNMQDGEDLYLRCFSSNAYNYKTSTIGTMACDFKNLGIKDGIALNSVLNIYPNPSQGKFTLESAKDPIKTLYIHDTHGRFVKGSEFEKNTLTFDIDISEVSPGIYFCNILAGENFYRHKLVVIK